ncbi:hypothetical protein SAMN05444389_11310 [Paracoccus solventivorans]|uniref:Flagellar protein FliL n=1 Tax=Paracoccus solventivorans TaxID=53463 RepID=A0A1M7JN96_9RHOB|nr:hypothetical protein [Paracoccus solventivorans]SHM54446.1 hypothetical protein SAMN05444389_11310 [Paracoccus solventivorans]
MLRKLLPVLLSVLALVAGAVGGDLLRGTTAAGIAAPDPQAALPADELPGVEPIAADNAIPPPPAAAPPRPAEPGKADAAAATAWFKFPQQFFVPVMHGGHLDSTMILSLSVEMPETASEEVYAHEIKLRDALLRQLLIHANTGGFDGNFTTEAHLRKLRAELTATARTIVPRIGEILIGDIARQER